MEIGEERIVTTDQLPDDPLKMPPPYWRSPGATLQIVDALQSLVELFHQLIPVLGIAEKDLDKYLEKYPEYSEDDVQMEEFGEIMSSLWELESKIKLRIDLAIFMSAIAIEDFINRFCVYNLSKDISESIEPLSFPDKFLIACSVVGKQGTKSNAVFEGVKNLSKWRNAYAHGHCVDRPTKSLRHNHLVNPPTYPNVWTSYNSLFDHCTAYLGADTYLRDCSLNSYTSGYSVENREIEDLLDELSRFTFLMPDDTGEIYTLKYEKETNETSASDMNP